MTSPLRRRLMAGVLTLTLLALPARAVSPFPDKVHQEVDYADMALESFDDSALRALVGRWEQLRSTGALRTYTPHTKTAVQGLIDELLAEYAHLETQYYLWGIASDANATDEDLTQSYLDYAQGFDQANDLCWDTLCLLTDTPYEDLLPVYPGPAPDGDGPITPSPEALRESELYLEEETLIRQYQQAMTREVWSTPYGDWSWAALNEADLENEEYDRISTAMEQAENQAVGPIFLELLALRREVAELNGYDSYADYAYEVLYGRNYTPDRSRALSEQVAAHLEPVYDRILEEMYYEMDQLLSLPGDDGETIWETLGPCLEDLHPALGEAWQYMMDHQLYDVEASPTKTFSGYTVPLAQYGTAFIFDSPYDSYQDYSSLIHEFGHFAQAHYDPTPALWAGGSVDLGEVHSQALEVLFTHYAEDLFPGNGEGFTWATLWSMVDSVLEGCMYDRFQQEVYALENPTLEEVNAIFKTVSEEFGYTYGPDETQSYFWVETGHNFSQPFYYISYATSALTAIDLWLTAQGDWEGAVEAYMALLAMDSEVSYTSALSRVGLRSIFRSETVSALAQELTDALEGNYTPTVSLKPTKTVEKERSNRSDALMTTILPTLLSTILWAWLITRFVRRRLKKAVANAGDLSHPAKRPVAPSQRRTPDFSSKKAKKGPAGDDPWSQDRKTGSWDPTKDPWE